MTHDLNNLDFAQIEARARILRAQAARNGFVSFRKAIANAFSTLWLRNSKPA